MKSALLSAKELFAQPAFINSSSKLEGFRLGHAFSSEALFLSRDVKSDWAIPLSRRRWGPANRGQLLLREIHGSELFGPDSRDAPTPRAYFNCTPPPPPSFPDELRVSHVTQFGNTTATWLDGALWILTVDAQFAQHIYHFSTRILSLFTAQRHNRSQVSER